MMVEVSAYVRGYSFVYYMLVCYLFSSQRDSCGLPGWSMDIQTASAWYHDSFGVLARGTHTHTYRQILKGVISVSLVGGCIVRWLVCMWEAVLCAVTWGPQFVSMSSQLSFNLIFILFLSPEGQQHWHGERIIHPWRHHPVRSHKHMNLSDRLAHTQHRFTARSLDPFTSAWQPSISDLLAQISTHPSTLARLSSMMVAMAAASSLLMLPAWLPYTLTTITALWSYWFWGWRTRDTISPAFT